MLAPISDFLFYIFGLGILLSGLCVVLFSNPMYALLCLIIAFFQAAGLFLLFQAEFLAMILLIVYVGAVCILILFVVMFLNVQTKEKKLDRFQKFSLFVGGVLLLELVVVALLWKNQTLIHPCDSAIGTMPNVTNTVSLGMHLYTTYVLIFQVCGMILLVAMIGAIVLTFTKERRGRVQDIQVQNQRSPIDTLRLMNPKKGQGVNYD